MSKLGKATLIATAAQAARQWARNNPHKADQYIDSAERLINGKTGGKYSKQVTGASRKAKEAVARGTVPSSTSGSAAPPRPGV